ncbi:YceI family protein [Magnetococcus sp. PR-3]|uniref:YceI family protein n=1 Tax=Magnetococcus sp. PR-3 TaxID=3120355 RepID=UPI002FCE3CAA
MKARLIKVATVTSFLLAALPNPLKAAEFQIDPSHSFVEFSIKHLGYSVLKGRFNTLSGSFSYDEKSPNASKISVKVETGSIDSNHAERDKHLRGTDFLSVGSFPVARFVSTAIQEKDGVAKVDGQLTLHGVTRPVSFDAKLIGAGSDPWGGYRRGYEGALTITRSDYGMDYNLGPASTSLTLGLFIEGIRQ